MTAPRLQLTGITKRYPAVVANDGVSLTVQPGETHAVLGENGAGKSTLMKIIYGSVKPDQGGVRWNGQPVAVRNPQQARDLGGKVIRSFPVKIKDGTIKLDLAYEAAGIYLVTLSDGQRIYRGKIVFEWCSVIKFLVKLEEQTLYIIALQKQIDEIKNEINILKKWNIFYRY